MREVKLYGHLGATFGSSFMLDVRSPAEAIAALAANFPNFREYLRKFSEPGYKVIVGDRLVGKEKLRDISTNSTIRFIPLVAGSGGRGVLQTVIGIILVVVGTFTSWTGAGAGVAAAGWGMIVGGVVQMLTPSPSTASQERADNQPSYTFSGAVNTITQGNPVQICYGEMVVGSQVISAGISTEQIYSTIPDYSNPGGGSWSDYDYIP